MSHQIKINRVANNMKMAAYWRTAEAIMAQIPYVLVEQLTSAQLVMVADAIHAAHQGGKAKAERDVLSEGAIYDPRKSKMREIAA